MDVAKHSAQIEDLKQQIEAVRHEKPKKAERLCRRLLALAEDTDDALAYCFAEYHLTILYAAEEDPLTVLDHIGRTRQLCLQTPGTEDLQIRLYNLEGIAYIRRGEYQQAMQCFLPAIRQAEAIDDPDVLMRLWISIAGIFLSLNQFHLVQQYLDAARGYLERLPEGPHRAFSQMVMDIDQATVYANTGDAEKTLALLNERFPQRDDEISDLLVSVYCLRANAEKLLGNMPQAIAILDRLVKLPVSTTLSLGTLMDAWKIALEYAIELKDFDRATEAFRAIEKAYAGSTSLDNRLFLAKARVDYHRCFGSQDALAAAYGDYYDLNKQFKEQELTQTAEALRVQINLSKMQAEIEKAQRDGLRMQSLSVRDELTGLANRRGWRDRLHTMIEEAKTNSGKVGLALLDLDHFKRYNDQYGHLFGDKVLCMAAKSLSMDTNRFFPGRYGGDEFILVFNGMEAPDVERMLDRVFAYLEQAQQDEAFAELPHITFSAGYVIADAAQVVQESDLIEQADQALYLSKKSNRNCYHGAVFMPDKPESV